LSKLRISYQSAGGSGGSAGGVLSGSIGPYQYWLLSPDATITVGQTSSLARDGAITAGFAAASGQFALRLANAPNTIIDGLSYGTITVNNLGEGTPASSPPTDGGLIRTPDGSDNNANNTDFVTVSNANIYLRNHNSINASANYTLPNTSYPADVWVSNLASVLLSGNSTISGKLTILSGSVTIGSNQSLTVSGTLTNSAGNSGLVIESDATGTGSLIHNNSGVDATVERYVTAANWSLASDGWHLLSSPVASQSISGSWTPTGTGNDYDFYALDETKTNEYWLNQKVSANNLTTFVPGIGYLVSYQQTDTKTFTGTLNSSNVTLSGLTNTAGSAFPGWHLAGNPFASAVDYDLGTWTKTNIDAEMQVWNSTAASYKTSTEVGGIIPAMNGFMVHTSGSGVLTIPTDARVHNSANWYKSGGSDFILLKANDLDMQTSQSSIVRFNNQATEDYDQAFDSYYIQGFAPLFYSNYGGKKYALNTLPELTDNLIIPFDFIKNPSANFNIELAQSIPDVVVYLTDHKTNIVTNLTETTAYSFTSQEGDASGRFSLHFKNAYSIADPVTGGDFNAYCVNGQLYVMSDLNGSVLITDIAGRQIATSSVSQGIAFSINLQSHPGIYLVKLATSKGNSTRKVVVR